MDNLEYIDNYFTAEQSPEQTRLFEQRILEDEGFANDLAFYLSTRQAAKEDAADESRERFRELYQSGKIVRMEPRSATWLRLPYVAAAVVAVILFSIFIWQRPLSTQQLADRYINDELKTVDVTMGKADDMQRAADFYNEKKYPQALDAYERLEKGDSTNTLALENAGKTCIQLGKYDMALTYFSRLENLEAFANPGKFYEALTLMKRNGPHDSEKAKLLLEEVVRQDLDKKETASEWLKKW